MPVYVDNSKNAFGRMKMCHMLADTLDELHAMADKIGIKRKWFQGNASTPHYDICLAKRQLAVKAGAIEIGRRETAKLIHRLRAQRTRVSIEVSGQQVAASAVGIQKDLF